MYFPPKRCLTPLCPHHIFERTKHKIIAQKFKHKFKIPLPVIQFCHLLTRWTPILWFLKDIHGAALSTPKRCRGIFDNQSCPQECSRKMLGSCRHSQPAPGLSCAWDFQIIPTRMGMGTRGMGQSCHQQELMRNPGVIEVIKLDLDEQCFPAWTGRVI